MKTTWMRKALPILGLVAVLGMGSYAYADWGMGFGRHMGYGWGDGHRRGLMRPAMNEGYGRGPGMMGYCRDGGGYRNDFSKANAATPEKERTFFFKRNETPGQKIVTRAI